MIDIDSFLQKEYDEFKVWFKSAPHRLKYTNDHPAYLSAWEAWLARASNTDKLILDWLEKQSVSVNESMRYGHGNLLVSAFVDLEEDTNKLREKILTILNKENQNGNV